MDKIEVEFKYRLDSEYVERVVSLLKERADSFWEVEKSDVYYRLNTKREDCLDVRIRREYTHPDGARHQPFEQGSNRNLGQNTEKESQQKLAVFTYKEREMVDVVQGSDNHSMNIAGEVNREYETELSNPEALVHFLKVMGGSVLTEKYKRGTGFRVAIYKGEGKDESVGEPIHSTVEVVEVPPLGYFLEIETVMDNTTVGDFIHSNSTKDNPTHTSQTDVRIPFLQEKMLAFVSALAIELGIEISRAEHRPYTELLLETSKPQPANSC